jgi:hypothetical protein
MLKGCDSDILDKARENFKLMDSNEPHNVLNAFLECCRYGMLEGYLAEGPNKSVILKDATVCISTAKFMKVLQSQKFNLADGLDIQPFLDTTFSGPVDKATKDNYFVIGRNIWDEHMSDLRHVPIIRIAR